ncbi:MAG TPA: hypothetical protein VLW25_08715 [Bryobacteraceae bacterium]|nr:hypothetical protein [Bryobacteraceae bacterium]
MHFQWFTTEHHRLHIIEEWPDSPHKEAALAAIRSKLASLARNLPSNSHLLDCEICLNREEKLGTVRFLVSPPVVESASSDLAA